jgi:hypothetical protein
MTVTKTESRPLGARLLAAQRAMRSPRLDSTNPHFRNKFASLAEVNRVAKEALNAEGLFLFQPTSAHDGVLCVATVVLSEDGEKQPMGEVGGPLPDDPQKIGSAITYYRRYGLAAAFALVADEDDDAEVAAAPVMHQKVTTDKASTPASEKQRKLVFATLREKGLDSDQLRAFAQFITGKEHSAEWTSADIDKLVSTDPSVFREMDPVVGGEK